MVYHESVSVLRIDVPNKGVVARGRGAPPSLPPKSGGTQKYMRGDSTCREGERTGSWEGSREG